MEITTADAEKFVKRDMEAKRETPSKTENDKTLLQDIRTEELAKDETETPPGNDCVKQNFEGERWTTP